ncbi:hypothetical protein [Hydrogenophaga sp.]|uniref:hypothetical protein n=1 Tax=Hydrogenophaga sp. TaxID=1904254 RepID=UPI0027283418|nr:hypothetical protein [Hydrogenophaga sp.]MDO9253484.1 hypothetical protein [Hydrogenophaga sp.]MDP3325592.1 hypothetical protein [Hydrogenophaga sp.]MDP3884565.1 hypothetical protein [Hydrogenophaga sp.]
MTSSVPQQAVDVRIFAAWLHPAFTTNRHERMHVYMGLGQQALGLRDLNAAEFGTTLLQQLKPLV